jgi:hypothetical protein
MKKCFVVLVAVIVGLASDGFAQVPTDQDVKEGIKRVIDKIPTDQDLKNAFDRAVGNKDAKERNAYKEAAKEVKQIEKEEKKQEKTTQDACTPTLVKTVKGVVDNPVQAAQDLSNNRMVGASKCDAEKEKLDDLKAKEAAAKREAAEKKAEYEAAKQKTGSWR